MGIVGPITADLPQAQTWPVDHVLTDWFFSDIDQYMLAQFGIRHIASRLRSWVPDLSDGLAVEMRWTGWGCRIEFVYGFYLGQEFLVVTKLGGCSCHPADDKLEQLSILAWSPNGMGLVRLPDRADRTINRRLSAIPAAATLEATALPLGEMLLAHAVAAISVAFGAHFAPPWLPAVYLAAQIPKAFPMHIALERRHLADLGKDYEMKEFAYIACFSPLPLHRTKFGTIRNHEPILAMAAIRFATPHRFHDAPFLTGKSPASGAALARLRATGQAPASPSPYGGIVPKGARPPA